MDYQERAALNKGILSMSLYNNVLVSGKLKDELEKTMDWNIFDDVFTDIRNLVEISRSSGIRAMAEYEGKTSSTFLKDILFLLSDLTKADEYEVFIYAHLARPLLYGKACDGSEFVKSFMYYEGILLLICGFSFIHIEYYLNNIIGKKIPAKQVFAQ